MTTSISLMVIQYLHPKQLFPFFLKHNMNFNIKFDYNAYNFDLTMSEFNEIFCQFPNVIITGLNWFYIHNHFQYRNEKEIFDELKVPIIFEKMKYIGIHDMIPNNMLKKCVNLRTLDIFSDSNFTDQVLKDIYHMTNIRRLHLQVSKSYDLALIAQNMPKIRYMYVSLRNSRVANINELTRFNKLRRLHLGGTVNSEVCSTLNQLKNIRYIVMFDDSNTMIPDLSNCHNLRKLGVSHSSHLISVDNLHIIKKLKYVKFRVCPNLSHIILKKCLNLKKVEIEHCPLCDVQIPIPNGCIIKK